MEVPHGVSEYEWVGGLQGGPVQVIEGDYTGLPIPAHAEIVIEAEALPGETREEGPFGEWTGYYASAMRHEPIMKVKRALSPKRSNPSRSSTDSSAVRVQLHAVLHARSDGVAGARSGGRARRARCVVPRVGRKPASDVRLHQAAVSGPRASSGHDSCLLPCRWLLTSAATLS